MKDTASKKIKYCFIINPFAGKGKHADVFRNNIPDICEGAGVEYDICVTGHIGEAKEYIQRIAGERQGGEEIGFFACGGDGTLCETVNAVMSLDNREGIYVGIVPIGTGNDFVRNFGAEEHFMNIEDQINAAPYLVDLIKCNDMYSVNMVNIGFDCEVVSATASFKRKPFIPSKFAYIAGLIATLIKKPGAKMKMSLDGGEAKDTELLLTTFAGGRYCGGGFYSNPKARLNDGKIDCIFVKNISRRRFVSLVGRYKAGTHLDDPKLEPILENKKLERIDMIFDKETNISVDGELIRAGEVRMEIIRNGLGLLLPRGAVTEGLECVWEASEARS